MIQQSLFHGYSKIDSVDIASLEILWDSVKAETYVQDKHWIYEDAYSRTKRVGFFDD